MNALRQAVLFVTAATLALPGTAMAVRGDPRPDGAPPRLPEGHGGIAAEYPGDVGIDRHPAVVFVEQFEGTLDEIADRWDNVRRRDIFSLSDDVPPGAASANSLLMTHTGGDGNGGHLYRRLLPGYERLFWRFYVKVDPDAGPLHHMPRIGGLNPLPRWPTGGAGSRPDGNESFRVGVGPQYGPDQSWDFYAYWNEMVKRKIERGLTKRPSDVQKLFFLMKS